MLYWNTATLAFFFFLQKCIAAFMLQQQKEVVAIEITYPAKPEILTL